MLFTRLFVFLIAAMIVASILSSCDDIVGDKKIYMLEVTYTNSETDTVIYKGTGQNTFYLDNGDLKRGGYCNTLLSGVRQFRVIELVNYGPHTSADSTWPCNLTLIPKRKL